MNVVALKRRLRELKRIEHKIRFSSAQKNPSPLVWDLFFDLQGTGIKGAKYPLKILAAMDHDTLKGVIDEYWSFVYSKLFNESEIPGGIKHDTGLLLKWGLPADADVAAIKKKFRELAKLYHPDAGGDEQSFIALMEAYNKLIGK